MTDIYATAIDYDPRKKLTLNFFATVQNKLHYAVHEHTAAELIYQRVDSEKPFVGMTNFRGNYGKISHEEAMKKAEQEYKLFKQKELANLKSNFDLFIEQTKRLQASS